MFQQGLSAVTISHFVSHAEIINFLNYYDGIRFVGRKNNRYHKCSPLIILKAFGPKRHCLGS